MSEETLEEGGVTVECETCETNEDYASVEEARASGWSFGSGDPEPVDGIIYGDCNGTAGDHTGEDEEEDEDDDPDDDD